MKKIVSLSCLLLLIGCQTKNTSQTKPFSESVSLYNNLESGNRGISLLDIQDRKIMENTSPRTLDRMDKGEGITISDIIKLSQGGINDEVIIRYIYSTKTTYHLTQAQIKRLRLGGVSQRVIRYIFDTRS